MRIFFIVFGVFLAACLLFTSLGDAHADTEESPDPVYLEAIKRREEKEVEARARGEVKTVPKVVNKIEPPKEQMCLKTNTCTATDFSSGSPAKKFVRNCKQYIAERTWPHSNEKLSQEAYACYAFLLSSMETLRVLNFVHAQENGEIYTPDEVKDVRADRKNCSFAVAETYPELYVDFMNRNPDLLDKYFAYSFYRFYKDITECTVYSGEIQKK